MSTGTVDQAVVEFPGMESFYVDRGGKSSPESDYGCHNVDDLGGNPTDPRPHGRGCATGSATSRRREILCSRTG